MLLKCLSIQQPWADLILSGEKRVENRTWIWLPDRNWKQAGKVLLGIHVSSSLTTWRRLKEKERERLVPGWTKQDSRFGDLQGVVDLIDICRWKNLPSSLRMHKYAIKKPNNWCWVLENPRRFASPVAVKRGNVFFEFEVSETVYPWLRSS